MEIQITFDHDREALEVLPLEKLARFVLEHEGKPDACEVSISFVTNETIKQLNEKYRQKAEPTDVLSFECDEDEEALAGEDGNDRTLILGDVIIAPDVARAQTKEYDTSFEEEISLLLVHGLLHLCGYDHVEDDEAERMESLEAELLAAWAQK